MRHASLLLAFLLVAATAAAQNTDIEALSGLQFNFGNPGARSLAMGGAFIGLADDASAAEANPAGLTILRKTEVSIESRQTRTSQSFVTGGLYPNITSKAFEARQTSISFASAVFPMHRGVLALYFHRPLAFDNRVDIAKRYATPTFYIGNSLHQIYPFTTTADVEIKTVGAAYAREWQNVSFGVAARYHQFQESATTMRTDLDVPGQPTFVITQNNAGRLFAHPSDSDVTFVGGIKWSPNPKLSLGAVYKEGASFPAPVSAARSTSEPLAIVGTTDFHVPTTIGAGACYRFTPMLLVNADVVRVSYGHLTDKFVSVIEYGSEDAGIEQLGGYRAKNATEFHVGAEYFLATRIPVALRGGWWRDPAHSIVYRGALDTRHQVSAAILFPQGRDENHYSAGIGLAWPRLQLDAAYDTSRSLKNASVSLIVRF